MLRHHPLMPYLAVGTGIATFGMMDATMKSASLAAGVYSALFLRSLIGAAIMLPVWRLADRGWPARPALRVHVIRSAVVAGMALLFFWGLVRTPMAEAIALSFIAPLIALYLAVGVLGERVERRAIIASLMGLGGVALIATGRIGAGGFTAGAGWGYAAILASAVLYAWNLILQRQQAQVASPFEIAFFQNACVAMVLAVAAPWLATLPPPAALAEIAAAAVLAAISLMLLSWGYARAEAQALVPLEYTAFIWAALFGWLRFDEKVTAATLSGVLLIIAACWIAARGRTEQTAL